MFGTRTGTLVLVSLVSIKFKNFALVSSQGFHGATLEIWSACLSYFGKYIKRFVKVRVTLKVKKQDNTQRLIMGKRYKNLFEKIVDIDNIRLAYKKALKGGNRYTAGHLKFKENLEANLFLLQEQLKSETYEHGRYHTFKVYEPKERLISSLPFRDRVIQHAINNIVEPIFENMFYRTSYACRTNKGTHKGVKDVQSKIRKLSKTGTVYYLKMDFSKYFHSINLKILFVEIEKKISDKKVLVLLRKFVSDNKVGIPIGNLLSQLFANIYGHIFDRFIKIKIKARYYFRYMDDTVILSNDNLHLRRTQKLLKIFSKLYMKLKFSHWHISSIVKPLNFLGYRITPSYKLIRKQSAVRAKRKVKFYVRTKQSEQLKMFLASWGGHLLSADSYNLKQNIKQEMRNARAS
jgi:retron-type reverse transcriptase